MRGIQYCGSISNLSMRFKCCALVIEACRADKEKYTMTRE